MRQRLPDLILLLGLLLACAWGVRAQHQAFAAQELQWAQDLAFFSQLLHSASEGRGFASDLLLEPTGFLRMVHFHPMLLAVVPLWKLWPSPQLLQALNVCLVMLAALPLAALGRDASGSRAFGAAAGLAWLVWLPTRSAALADFRPMELWALALTLLIWGVWSRRWGALLAGAVLCCAAREEASYTLIAAGGALLFLPFNGPARRQGLAVMGLGLAWFGFLLLFKENFFFHFDPLNPPVGEPTPDELRDARLGWLGRAWLGGWLAAPLSPAPFALVSGPFAWLWTDAQREWQLPTGPYVHLRVALLPAFAASGVLGAAALARRWPRLTLPLALGMVLGNCVAFPEDREALRRRQASIEERLASPEQVAVVALLSRVGPEDKVATDYRLIGNLAPRDVLWNAVHLYLPDARPPHWTEPWPITLDVVDTLVLPLDDPLLAKLGGDWVQEAQGGGYGLWRRRLE